MILLISTTRASAEEGSRAIYDSLCKAPIQAAFSFGKAPAVTFVKVPIFLSEGVVMHVFWMIIVGLIVGAIAKLLMPGHDPGGIIVTMLLGIAGSLVAGFLGRAIG